jgi:hypothetical protein
VALWQNDASISDDEILWRRVLADDPAHVKKDPVTGEPRPNSGAFRSSKEITSVGIASLTTIDDFLASYPRHSIVGITARAVREAGCMLVRDRIENEGQEHIHIVASRADGILTGGEARKLADRAQWVLYRIVPRTATPPNAV